MPVADYIPASWFRTIIHIRSPDVTVQEVVKSEHLSFVHSSDACNFAITDSCGRAGGAMLFMRMGHPNVVLGRTSDHRVACWR